MSSDTTWRLDAACQNSDPLQFTNPTKPTGLRVCHTCPVQPACLDYALGLKEQGWPVVGVWGGQIFHYRFAYGKKKESWQDQL